MTYLNYFQFDDEPFSNKARPKYKFAINGQMKVFSKLLNICYSQFKTSFVYGKEGVGKTFLIRELFDVMDKSKHVIIFNSKSSKNIKDVISENTKNSKKKMDENKRKTVFIIDGYEELLQSEKEFLLNNCSEEFLEENLFNIIIFSAEPIGYIWEKDKLTKIRFRIPSMGLRETYLYTRYMIEKTKSVNSWKSGFPKWFVLLISILSNGRVKFVNTLAEEAIKNAYRKKRHRASVRGLLGYFTRDMTIIRTNISERFKHICIILTFGMLLIEGYSIIKEKRYNKLVFEVKQEIEMEFNEGEKASLAKNENVEKSKPVVKKAKVVKKVKTKPAVKKAEVPAVKKVESPIVKKAIEKKAVVPAKKVVKKKSRVILNDDGRKYVKVASGDYFGKIAKDMNLTRKELGGFNPEISDTSKIKLGQKIYLENKVAVKKTKVEAPAKAVEKTEEKSK